MLWKGLVMGEIKKIIVIVIAVFMLVDIGFKVSILDALEKKQNSPELAKAYFTLKDSQVLSGKEVAAKGTAATKNNATTLRRSAKNNPIKQLSKKSRL